MRDSAPTGMESPQLRVGIITENHYPRLGGLEFATHFLAEALNRVRDVHAAVACSDMPEVPRDFRYSYPVWRHRSLSVLTPLLRGQSLRAMVKNERVSVLHGQMLHGGGLAAVHLGRKLGLPVVVQSHGADVQYVPEIDYGFCRGDSERGVVRRVLAAADRIIAVSQINARDICDLGCDPARIAVVPNGCQYEQIGQVRQTDARLRLGLKDDDFVVITVGRNSPVKRLGLLYEALGRLRSAGMPIRCVSVGPRESIEPLAASHGVQHAVIATGPIPASVVELRGAPPFADLINLYRSANLYVSVSFVEAFGMSALDALAAGTPVLVGPRHGIRDVVRSGETGFILEDETVAGLAEALRHAYEDRDRLGSQRHAIRESVADLSWDRVALRHVQIYAAVCA